MDAIRSVIISYNKKRLYEEDHTLEQLNDTLNSLVDYTQTTNELRTVCRRKITIAQKNRDTIFRTLNYLEHVLQNIQSTDDNCMICLEEFNDLSVTKCGHKFCFECISHNYKVKIGEGTSIKCPACNTLITNNDIYYLYEINTIDATNDIETFIKSAKSTKIGSIIYDIKNSNKSDKIILFSQFDEMLDKIGLILQQHNINTIKCKGSVFQCKNSIDSFNNDNCVKVILLSSNHAASGLNLQKANIIMFVEPVYGTKEYRENIESQAIARSLILGQKNQINVIRYIIKDTIEEEIYNSN